MKFFEKKGTLNVLGTDLVYWSNEDTKQIYFLADEVARLWAQQTKHQYSARQILIRLPDELFDKGKCYYVLKRKELKYFIELEGLLWLVLQSNEKKATGIRDKLLKDKACIKALVRIIFKGGVEDECKNGE